MANSHWVDAESIFEKVVALTDDVVYVANPQSEEALAAGEALERGEAASTVLKNDVTPILIASIDKVSYNRNGSDADLHYRVGKEKESKNIGFASRESRDDFAAQLAERLPDFECKVVEYGKFRAAVGPLGFAAFTAFATWGLHAAAVAIAAGAEANFEGRRAGLKRVLFWSMEFVGPVGVLLVGASVLAATTWYLIHRVKTPPVMHTLKRP